MKEKKKYLKIIKELKDYLEEQKQLNKTNLINTIDTISKNFDSLNKDDSYNLQTVLSELRIVNNLNDENYLILLSKYSKVVDDLKIVNYYENKLKKFKTPKPEIINILGKLYFNIILSNKEYDNNLNINDIDNSNLHKRQKRRKNSKDSETSINSISSAFSSLFESNAEERTTKYKYLN